VALRGEISPFFIQTPGTILMAMAGIFLLVLLMSVAVNAFSGSRPRRFDWPVEACTPGATLVMRRFGRRRVTACCLCREGDFLVVYRFRKPLAKIDIRRESQEIVWGKRSFRYKDFRVILAEAEFQDWRLRLMG
jgi:hypothetical protein